MDTLIKIAGEYLIVAVGLIGVAAALLSKGKVRTGIIKLAILSFPIAFLAAWVAGHLYYDTRPFVVENVQPIIHHPPDNGFPSDHTLYAMVTAAVVFAYHRKIGLFLGILGIIIGIARVAGKVHHPVDIIGSIAIALAATGIAWLILRRVDRGFGRPDSDQA